MFTIIFRAVLIYIVVLFVFRIMGKRQIGQMQPFELVLTLIIADLATIPMAEIGVPVLHGIIPLLTLVIIHFVISLLTKISPKVGKFISGKPVIIVNPKGIDYQAMKQLDISIDDLFEGIRGQGFFSLEQIQYAIMETTGKISVMPKSEFAPVTNDDMNNKVEQAFLPVNLVNEGKIVFDNLPVAKVDVEFIKKILSKKIGRNAKVKDILIFTLSKEGKVCLQMKNGAFQSFEVSK